MGFIDNGFGDGDDLFATSRMPLGDHIEELRRRLLWALLGFGVAVALGFFVSDRVLHFIAAPVERELAKLHQRRLERLAQRLAEGDPELTAANQPRDIWVSIRYAELRRALGLPADRGGKPEWVDLPVRVRPLDLLVQLDPRGTARPPTLTALTVTEPFLVYFKVSLGCGVVLASPWIFWQLWAFVAAGLYPREKRLVYRCLPLSIALFLAGVCLCQFVVLPLGVEYLLSFHEWLDVEPELRLADWLNFALLMPLVFGCAFQTPLVMFFLDRLGIVGVQTYRTNRRLAIFLLTVLAALLTVTPDWFNMMALAVPLWLLYELGILLCSLSQPPAEHDDVEATAV